VLHATSLFKSETGCSIVEYIINVRIEKAKALLGNPNIKISEVAQNVGYNNIACFSSLFKNQPGSAPGNTGNGFTCNKGLLKKVQKTGRMEIDMKRILSKHTFGDMAAVYITDETGRVGIVLVPVDLMQRVDFDKDCAIDSLIQLKLAGDAYPGSFGCGLTMRNSATLDRFRFEKQIASETDESITVNVILKANGLSADHWLVWNKDCEAIESRTAITNNGNDPVSLEMLSSFSLGMLTPFQKGMSPENLCVYRMRSRWSSEAHLEKHLAEELLLVPSWLPVDAYSERFGHVGTKPSNRFIPFAAVEDMDAQVLWGANIYCSSSWQLEFYRRDNGLCLSGGLADSDFGSWMITLQPGESFTSPRAFISVCSGDIDLLCSRLTSAMKRPLQGLPASEQALPVMFNEWCTSWGNPDHDSIVKLVDRLHGTPVKYLIIDAGWYKDAAASWTDVAGDWIPSKEKYPEGMEKTIDTIRAAGFVPGIWFEFETCGQLSKAYSMDAHHLHKFGFPLICGTRKFWDFRDPWVWDYLCRRVIGFLKKYRIGYVKFDSNESAGLGCDGAESLGEGLRAHIQKVEEFIREVRRQIPDIVIENCSSGGQRLVGSMMEITSLASFSDAHECVEIPIIAANLHRVIQPRQSQIWCVLRKEDSEKRLIYSLANTFLGRMCLSGDIYDLSEVQTGILNQATAFYEKAAGVIKDGVSRRYGPDVINYRQPDGWQAIIRESTDHNKVLAVIHTFSGQQPNEIQLPLPEDRSYEIDWTFCLENTQCNIDGQLLNIKPTEEFEGIVVMATAQQV
jgi:alpha-galactosidase